MLQKQPVTNLLLTCALTALHQFDSCVTLGTLGLRRVTLLSLMSTCPIRTPLLAGRKSQNKEKLSWMKPISAINMNLLIKVLLDRLLFTMHNMKILHITHVVALEVKSKPISWSITSVQCSLIRHQRINSSLNTMFHLLSLLVPLRLVLNLSKVKILKLTIL